ncbi:hypothetical protein [Vibrio jasicida]|uniref:hypothetical protein n=1 Tax=Vibrio jasicida TaxID=766224 RepID=UPI0005F07CF3|nr:hypothetical protein [Vibrio jasicida]
MAVKILADFKNWKFYFSYKKVILKSISYAFVIIGLSSIVTNWAQEIIQLNLVKYGIEVPVESLDLIAWGILFIGGVLCFISYRLDKKEKLIKADKKLALAFKDQDFKVNQLLESLYNDRSYLSSNDSALNVSYSITNGALDFQYNKTKKLFDGYKINAKNLHSFYLVHSSVFPREQTSGDFRYCFKPEWDIDRSLNLCKGNEERYMDLCNELDKKIKLVKLSIDSLSKHLNKLYDI